MIKEGLEHVCCSKIIQTLKLHPVAAFFFQLTRQAVHQLQVCTLQDEEQYGELFKQYEKPYDRDAHLVGGYGDDLDGAGDLVEEVDGVAAELRCGASPA
jgi:hypothetical protein